MEKVHVWMEVTLVGNGCRQEKAATSCASSSPPAPPYPILQALGHTAAADINFNFLIAIPNMGKICKVVRK